MLEVARLARSGRFDMILLDTAPTGHTLRMLTLPEAIHQWISMFEALSRRNGERTFLTDISEEVRFAGQILRSSQRTEFIVVTLPEPVVAAETERLLVALKACGIAVRTLVVNRVQEAGKCPQCKNRNKLQKAGLKILQQDLQGYRRIDIPQLSRPVSGVTALEAVGQMMLASGRAEETPTPPPTNAPVPTLEASIAASELADMNLLLFAGKGGVGKTTLAAATALWRARKRPNERVLLFSCDPAHSLGDVLDQRVGSTPTKVAGVSNLYAQEVDAAQALHRLRQQVRAGLEAAVRDRAGWLGVGLHRGLIERWIELTPPGLDEIMAMKAIMDMRIQGRTYDLIVVDTTPTGHLLNLLRTPDMAQRWLSFLVNIIGRHNENGSMGGLEQGVLELRRSVEKLHATLSDVESTATIAVAAAEPMGVLKLERLLEGLRELGMACRHVIFNRLVQPAPCALCETRRQQESEQIRAFITWSQSGWRKHAPLQITGVPLATREVHGVPELTALGERLFSS